MEWTEGLINLSTFVKIEKLDLKFIITFNTEMVRLWFDKVEWNIIRETTFVFGNLQIKITFTRNLIECATKVTKKLRV